MRPKDKIVVEEKCGVTYNMKCRDFDAEYNGETARKLGTRHKMNTEKANQCKPATSSPLSPNMTRTQATPLTGPA